MKIEELKQIVNAPEQGHVLAYFRQGIIFEEYFELNVLIQSLEKREAMPDELLELHLFNMEKEYRCVSTRSKRYPDGVIEHVANFEADLSKKAETNVFRENVSLEKGKGILTILNHIKYQEKTGMAMVDDYRLLV